MSCYNSTVVQAPVDQVWAKLRDFHDMSWAKGVIDSCEVVSQIPATQIGAKRVLNKAFHETLRGLDDSRRVLAIASTTAPTRLPRTRLRTTSGK